MAEKIALCTESKRGVVVCTDGDCNSYRWMMLALCACFLHGRPISIFELGVEENRKRDGVFREAIVVVYGLYRMRGSVFAVIATISMLGGKRSMLVGRLGSRLEAVISVVCAAPVRSPHGLFHISPY